MNVCTPILLRHCCASMAQATEGDEASFSPSNAAAGAGYCNVVVIIHDFVDRRN